MVRERQRPGLVRDPARRFRHVEAMRQHVIDRVRGRGPGESIPVINCRLGFEYEYPEADRYA